MKFSFKTTLNTPAHLSVDGIDVTVHCQYYPTDYETGFPSQIEIEDIEPAARLFGDALEWMESRTAKQDKDALLDECWNQYYEKMEFHLDRIEAERENAADLAADR